MGYIPSTTKQLDNVQGMLPPAAEPKNPYGVNLGITYPNTGALVKYGQYDSVIVRKELEFYNRTCHLSNIRMYGSFIAWLFESVNPAGNGYIDNLKDIATICKSLGMTITYKLWSTASIDTSPANQTPRPIVSLHDNVLSIGPSAFKMDYAKWHLHALWATVDRNAKMQGVIPLAGSFFNTNTVVEPDVEMQYIPWRNWDQRYRNYFLVLSSGITALMRSYVREVAGAIKDVVYSFDLYNEPEIWWPQDNGDLISNIADWIVESLREVVSVVPNAEFTVGMGGFWSVFGQEVLIDLYQAIEGRGEKLSYASFHEWNNFGPTHLTFIRDQIAQRLKPRGGGSGMQTVISEFYAPFGPLSRTLGQVQNAVTTMRQLGIGGQVWSLLESNAFALSSSSDLGVRPVDGLAVPVDNGNPSVSSLQIIPRSGLFARDLNALQQWAQNP